MSWEDKLRDYLKEKGFGIYIVELKDPFFFEVKGNQDQIRIIRTQTYSLEARHPLGMRTLIGVHRSA